MSSLQSIRHIDFSELLTNEIHPQIIAKMKRNTNKRAAKELQDILQEIKITAEYLDQYTDDPIVLRMREQYKELIETAFNLQKVYHGKKIKASTLFRRGAQTKTIKESDNIFEEDLAAIIAAGEILGGNKNFSLEMSLTGTKTASTKSIDFIKEKDLNKAVIKIINQLSEKESKRIAPVKSIKKTAAKIDVHGNAITLNYSLPLQDKIKKLMVLMKDATFSAKSYTSRAWDLNNAKNFSEIGLTLGSSNLYKSITGALSEIYRSPKTQQHIFFRGMNTMINNSNGYKDITKEHFSHLRFIYELRGSGLLDDNGKIKNVKYLIYNDPSSDAIFVKDTASIIIESLNAAYHSANLFGEVTIAASKVKS